MILVTGGSGFVGRALLQALAQRRAEPLRILSRKPSSTLADRMPPGIEVVHGDLAKPAGLDTVLEGVSTVIHLAGILAGEPDQLQTINVVGARALALAASRAGVGSFIHVSSAGVYGSAAGEGLHREEGPFGAATPYEVSKLQGEQAVVEALRGSDTGLIVLRPAGVYGGDRPATQAFLRDVAQRRIWFRLPPRVIIHPTYVADVVQGILRSLDRVNLSGEVFNLGGDCALSLDDWAALAARAMQVRLPQLTVPTFAVVPAARGLSVVATAFGRPTPDRLRNACHPVMSRALDINKARIQLGYVPAPLNECLEASIEQARTLGAL